MPLPTGKTYVNLRKIRAILLVSSPRSIADVSNATNISRDTITGLLRYYGDYIRKAGYGQIEITPLGHEFLENAGNIEYGRSDEEISESVGNEVEQRELARLLAEGGSLESSPILSEKERIEARVKEEVDKALKIKNAEPSPMLAMMQSHRDGREKREKRVTEKFPPDDDREPRWVRDAKGHYEYWWYLFTDTKGTQYWTCEWAVPNVPEMKEHYDPDLPSVIFVRNNPKIPPGATYSADPKWKEMHEADRQRAMAKRARENDGD